MLQLKSLSADLGEEPCIEFIQENSMENSVQDLSTYIVFVHGLCYDCASPTLMPMLCSHVHYSSIMLLPQGHHAMSMCPDIISFNLHHHVYTIQNPCHHS